MGLFSTIGTAGGILVGLPPETAEGMGELAEDFVEQTIEPMTEAAGEAVSGIAETTCKAASSMLDIFS